ncbi:unnamed protein product [Caenorhabditis sp. 36 PRJEB53466]|nr:unnamed protein product [Caenorhabditis sp. 36 PRJEB53466]
MSEAEAGPDRGQEGEPPCVEKLEPAAVKKAKEDRRSMSLEANAGENIKLQTICYRGTTLQLPVAHPHMYQVVFRILKYVYNPLVKQILVGLPIGWLDSNPTNEEIASYVEKYNMAAKPYAKNWGGSYNTETLKDWGHPQCSQKVAIDITTFAYECAVPRPANLNSHYKSFSSETYGETNLEQMASIIDELKLGPQDVFVDLGSGIGTLVAFTAAYSKVKRAVGIELLATPANIAAQLGVYFKRLMSHFGKNCGKFEMIQGDFLNPKFKKLICEEATVIFINNFAFNPDLMNSITNEILQDLKHGIRIVTTKPFGSSKKEITYRSTSDITSMSTTVKLRSLDSGVSWTANKVDFYLTTMDHTKLIRYYEEEQKKKNPKAGDGSDVVEIGKKRKADYGSKSKTEQAAASLPHQSPKWNEPDTDYAPPAKKSKKHRDTADSAHAAASTSKKKKSLSGPKEKKEKTPKTHSNRHNQSLDRSGANVPSQPKATAPPPIPADQKPKREEPAEQEIIHTGQLDAKTMSALHTIREAATTSSQAAAIQDAINSVLSQAEVCSKQQTEGFPSAPVAPQPHIIPPSSEVAADKRHTFMIPPTDPMYNMIVGFYFEFKSFADLSKHGDQDFINQLRKDIENERSRRNELEEGITSTRTQIDDLLGTGVSVLQNKLHDLGMHDVHDVHELLSGSKNIVTQHKALTTEIAQTEQIIAVEEQKLRRFGGPDVLRLYEDATVVQQNQLDMIKLRDIVLSSRPQNFISHLHPDEHPTPDSKISPSSRRPRQKPRAAPGNGKRGTSAGRKADDPSEDMELKIQQFVQHALKVDNAVKEKERKERLHRPSRPIVTNNTRPANK